MIPKLQARIKVRGAETRVSAAASYYWVHAHVHQDGTSVPYRGSLSLREAKYACVYPALLMHYINIGRLRAA